MEISMIMLYFLIGIVYVLLTFQVYLNSKMLHKLNNELKEQLELTHKIIDTKLGYKMEDHHRMVNDIHKKLESKR